MNPPNKKKQKQTFPNGYQGRILINLMLLTSSFLSHVVAHGWSPGHTCRHVRHQSQHQSMTRGSHMQSGDPPQMLRLDCSHLQAFGGFQKWGRYPQQIIQKYISLVILVLKLGVLGLGYPPFEEAPIWLLILWYCMFFNSLALDCVSYMSQLFAVFPIQPWMIWVSNPFGITWRFIPVTRQQPIDTREDVLLRSPV